MELLHKYGLALDNHPIVFSFPKRSLLNKIIWLFVLAVEFRRLVQFLFHEVNWR
jgi:hypothetical protein